MPQSGIYAISNTITGDVYIGSSCNIERRQIRHFRELRQGIHHSQYLQRAFIKYGEEAFVFKVVEEVLPERKLLIAREQYWIETTHPAYNMNPLATNNQGMKASEATKQHLLRYSMMRTPEQRKTMLGKKHSEETKRKMAEKAKARRELTEEEREKLSEAAKNRKYTDEGRQKRAESMKKRWEESPLSEESRHNISEKNKAYWQNLSEEERRIRSEQARNRPPISEETRQKLRDAKLGRKQSEEHIQKRVNGRKAKQQ